MNISTHPRLPALTTLASLLLILAPPQLAGAPAAKSPQSRPGATRTAESVRAGTTVAPDGQTAVISVDRKWDARTGTGTINESAVTSDGRISLREANLTRQPDGTIFTKGSFTDFDGQPFNYTETTRRTADGQLVEGRMTDVDGKVSTYVTTAERTENNQTRRTMVITRPDGSKETRVELLAPPRGTTLAAR